MLDRSVMEGFTQLKKLRWDGCLVIIRSPNLTHLHLPERGSRVNVQMKNKVAFLERLEENTSIVEFAKVPLKTLSVF